MARVLAISSQVARGAIGLSAAVPALQAFGHEVIALPTILLSNHPGHARFAGEHISPELLGRMMDALEANGWLAGFDAVLTGYLPSVDHVAFAQSAVERVTRQSPSAVYLCDPVLGDHPKGLYIAHDAANAIRDRLLPIADMLKMNRFEAEWLCGCEFNDKDDFVRAARARRWHTTVITSLPSQHAGSIANVLVDGTVPALAREVNRRDRVPNGTGDLLGALWLGHRLRPCSNAEAFERAVAGVELVLSRSIDTDELQLIGTLKDLVS
ncbi:MAG: pyridoxal kinase [Hyphomicrobiaceae bacterium]